MGGKHCKYLDCEDNKNGVRQFFKKGQMCPTKRIGEKRR